jgi:hypothetical protein
MQVGHPNGMEVMNHMHDVRLYDMQTRLVESPGKSIGPRRLVTCGLKDGRLNLLRHRNVSPISVEGAGEGGSFFISVEKWSNTTLFFSS